MRNGFGIITVLFLHLQIWCWFVFFLFNSVAVTDTLLGFWMLNWLGKLWENTNRSWNIILYTIEFNLQYVCSWLHKRMYFEKCIPVEFCHCVITECAYTMSQGYDVTKFFRLTITSKVCPWSKCNDVGCDYISDDFISAFMTNMGLYFVFSNILSSLCISIILVT
jgi:hypothetical protein